MKLLMTADTIGGVWTYAIELVKSYQRFNVEVHLACMGKLLSEDQQQQAALIPNLIIHSQDYKLEWMQDPWNDIEKAGDWLMDLNEKIQPDLVHLNTYVHGNLPWNVPVVMVAHSCVLSWWKAVKGEKAPEEWNRYYKEVKEGFQAADLVIGVSRHYLKEVINLYGPLRLAKVIYNGLEADAHETGSKKEYVFGMGRVWDEGKNLRLLAERSQDIKWPVKIAGNKNHPDDARNSIIEEDEIFLGQLSADGIKKYLSEASIFVLPAKYEPFGLSALEAALSGCALILSDIPTLKEIWGDAALYVNINDPQELEGTINGLIDDKALLLEYQHKAKERALQYSLVRMTSAYMECYAQIMKYKLQNSN